MKKLQYYIVLLNIFFGQMLLAVPVPVKGFKSPTLFADFGKSITTIPVVLNERGQPSYIDFTIWYFNQQQPNRRYTLLNVANINLEAPVKQDVNMSLTGLLANIRASEWIKGIYLYPFFIQQSDVAKNNYSVVTDFSNYTQANVYIAVYNSKQKLLGTYQVSGNAGGGPTTAQVMNFMVREALVTVDTYTQIFPMGNVLFIKATSTPSKKSSIVKK